MKDEKPILFKGEMVRAILRDENPKTQTRRLVNGIVEAPGNYSVDAHMRGEMPLCPHGQPGTRLWVKETFYLPNGKGVFYRADWIDEDGEPDWKWKPSIFMPRWASRITLEITNVRVERLQDISREDAIAEGIFLNERDWWDCGNGLRGESAPELAYRALWNSINLSPSPLYETGDDGKKRIVSYCSFPWSNEDFDAEYPGVRERGAYRGKPITVTANPFVWILGFRRVRP